MTSWQLDHVSQLLVGFTAVMISVLSTWQVCCGLSVRGSAPYVLCDLRLKEHPCLGSAISVAQGEESQLNLAMAMEASAQK